MPTREEELDKLTQQYLAKIQADRAKSITPPPVQSTVDPKAAYEADLKQRGIGQSTPQATQQSLSPQAQLYLEQIKAKNDVLNTYKQVVQPPVLTPITPGKYKDYKELEAAYEARQAKLEKNAKGSRTQLDIEVSGTVGLPTNMAEIETANRVNEAKYKGAMAQYDAAAKELQAMEGLVRQSGKSTTTPGAVRTYEQYQSLMTPQEKIINQQNPSSQYYVTRSGQRMVLDYVPGQTKTGVIPEIKLPNIEYQDPKYGGVEKAQYTTEALKGKTNDYTPKGTTNTTVKQYLDSGTLYSEAMDFGRALTNQGRSYADVIETNQDNWNKMHSALGKTLQQYQVPQSILQNKNLTEDMIEVAQQRAKIIQEGGAGKSNTMNILMANPEMRNKYNTLKPIIDKLMPADNKGRVNPTTEAMTFFKNLAGALGDEYKQVDDANFLEQYIKKENASAGSKTKWAFSSNKSAGETGKRTVAAMLTNMFANAVANPSSGETLRLLWKGVEKKGKK